MATHTIGGRLAPFRWDGTPGTQAFVVLKLRPGWVLDSGRASVRSGSRQVVPELPAGAALAPALPIAAPARGLASPAERELARYLHLRLPPGVRADEGLALVLGWAFVERADLP